MGRGRSFPASEKECRRRAIECVEAASAWDESETQRAFIDLAVHWLKLAHQAHLDGVGEVVAPELGEAVTIVH